MHLFGDTSKSHLWRVHAFHRGNQVTFDWEVRNAPKLRWRILRSEEGYAASPEPPGDNGQTLVCETSDTHIADTCEHGALYYTFFSNDQTGDWQRQIETKVKAHEGLSWFHRDAGQEALSKADFLHNDLAAGDALANLDRGRAGLKLAELTQQQPQNVEQWVRIEGM
jgi:hypothetical protein